MRTLIILLLSFLISGLSLAGVRIEHWTAPSGAKVYFVETRVVPILDVQIDFAGGGAFVPAAKSGLAGLTRSLLEAGAGDMDEERIAGRLVDLGDARVHLFAPEQREYYHLEQLWEKGKILLRLQ